MAEISDNKGPIQPDNFVEKGPAWGPDPQTNNDSFHPGANFLKNLQFGRPSSDVRLIMAVVKAMTASMKKHGDIRDAENSLYDVVLSRYQKYGAVRADDVAAALSEHLPDNMTVKATSSGPEFEACQRGLFEMVAGSDFVPPDYIRIFEVFDSTGMRLGGTVIGVGGDGETSI